MSWAKFKSFANQFIEDATHASNLVVAGVGAVSGGRQTLDISDHWLHVRTFFRDAQNHSEPSRMAARLPEVEAELDKIIQCLLEERAAFLACIEDSSLLMPDRFDFILGGVNCAADSASDLVDDLFEDNPEKESGRQLITTVCQFAKHDIPEGSRSVVLRFLTKLFRDVDANTGKRSLLHYSNDYIALPLVDAVERIFHILNPWVTRGSDSSGRVSRSIQRDRYEFVALLHALSSKVENIPSVAALFMILGPSRGGTATNVATDGFGGAAGSSSSSSPQRSATESNAPRLLLVEGLVPFVQDYIVDLPDTDRITMTRRALAGILSIARTPDPILREMIVSDNRIVTLATQQLCHAMVTAAKVPDNAEYTLNVAYVCDAVSFLDAIVLSTPYVARMWHVQSRKFVDSFLKGTVRMLLMSVDERVYANTANILALLLQVQALRSEPLRGALTNFLFEHDPELAGSEGEVLEDLEAHLNHASTGAPSPPIPSLFETAILPRIHDVNDLCVCSTLALIRVLMEQLPAAFMRHVLGISTEFKIPLAILGGGATPTTNNGNNGAAVSSPHNYLPGRSPSTLVPVLNLDSYFPKSLVTDKGLWDSTTAVFANDVLRRMLLTESMMSGEAGEALRHQPKFDAGNEALFVGELGFSADSVPSPQEVAGNERLRRSLAAAATAHVDAGAYCLPKLNSNPFVAALSSKFATFTEHSSTVNMELTGVASSLCLLPDCRIFYTLFDIGRRGAFASALQRKANLIDEAMHADRERCAALNKDPSLIVPSRSTLFKALLTEKKDPFLDAYVSGLGKEGWAIVPGKVLYGAGSGSVGNGAAHHHADPNIIHHRGATHKAGVNNDLETSRFVEACVILEGFRHEMRAIIGQVEVSLKLMELAV